MGIVLPLVRVRDEKRLPPQRYEIRVFGSRVADGEVHADRQLAINPGSNVVPLDGLKVTDPAYGLPAYWIRSEQKQQRKAWATRSSIHDGVSRICLK
jgi:flagellar biosynthesis protein FlhA